MKIFDDDVPLNSFAPDDEVDDIDNKLLVGINLKYCCIHENTKLMHYASIASYK